MSALGIWNNQYEGGPCYAACMETFTLYVFHHIVIILQYSTVGKDAIMELAGSMTLRGEMKLPGCARDTLLNLCGPSLGSCSPSLI